MLFGLSKILPLSGLRANGQAVQLFSMLLELEKVSTYSRSAAMKEKLRKYPDKNGAAIESVGSAVVFFQGIPLSDKTYCFFFAVNFSV